MEDLRVGIKIQKEGLSFLLSKYENSCLDFVYFSILGKGISGCPYMDYGGYIVDSGGYMYQGRF